MAERRRSQYKDVMSLAHTRYKLSSSSIVNTGPFQIYGWIDTVPYAVKPRLEARISPDAAFHSRYYKTMARSRPTDFYCRSCREPHRHTSVQLVKIISTRVQPASINTHFY